METLRTINGVLMSSVNFKVFGVKPGNRKANYYGSPIDPNQPNAPRFFTDEEMFMQATFQTNGGFISKGYLQGRTSSSSWFNLQEMEMIQKNQYTSNFNISMKMRPDLVGVRPAILLEGAGGEAIEVGTEYRISIKPPPRILTFISMGGSSGGIESGSSSGDGIEVNPDKCKVDPELISILTSASNVQCNNLCAPCISFIEYLGLRILNEENLAGELKSLRSKEKVNQSDYCCRKSNTAGLKHEIILGKWENSEHEFFRPSHIKTFDSILDEYEKSGGGSLIVIANSHGAAKMIATLDEHWRWGKKIRVELLVLWDATHFGGALTKVGSRPRRVVNFFQKGNFLEWLQNGSSIVEADLEYDLSKCFSHNAIPRSAFVQDTTYREVRTAVAKIRDASR